MHPALSRLPPPRSPCYSPPPMRHPLLLLVLVGLVACAEPESKPKVDLGERISNVPIPPGAEGLGRDDGENAVQLRFRTPLPVDTIVEYYRVELSKAPWRLVNESRMPDGSVAFYAEQDGPPLWVNVRPGEGSGTLVDVAGAKVN